MSIKKLPDSVIFTALFIMLLSTALAICVIYIIRSVIRSVVEKLHPSSVESETKSMESLL
jgi:hypothetical protein